MRLRKPWLFLRSSRWLLGVAAAAMLIAIVPFLQSVGRVQMPGAADELSREPAANSLSPASVLKSLGYGASAPFVDSAAAEFSSAPSAAADGGARGYGRVGPAAAEWSYSHSATSGVFDSKAAGGRGSPASPGQGSASPPSADRFVVRKATIELRVADIRAVFRKASFLISEAHGEYVQESSLAGVAPQLQADLTLRVTAERLATVLAELRGLGEVHSEVAGGEDVTTQVVDLEARLRNERRVEAELLELLEKRTDAPLREVLELRQAIAGVRQSIETMAGQRERLGRLVSLATVLVVIRAADAPLPQTPGLGTYFFELIQSAATRGVRTLIETFAGLIFVLIGGALWIIGLLVVALVAWRSWRAAPR